MRRAIAIGWRELGLRQPGPAPLVDGGGLRVCAHRVRPPTNKYESTIIHPTIVPQTTLDLSAPFRFTGVPNNATVDLMERVSQSVSQSAI